MLVRDQLNHSHDSQCHIHEYKECTGKESEYRYTPKVKYIPMFGCFCWTCRQDMEEDCLIESEARIRKFYK